MEQVWLSWARARLGQDDNKHSVHCTYFQEEDTWAGTGEVGRVRTEYGAGRLELRAAELAGRQAWREKGPRTADLTIGTPTSTLTGMQQWETVWALPWWTVCRRSDSEDRCSE